MNRFTAPLALAMLLVAGVASANGDAEAGKTKAVTCQACHSLDGNASDPQYPRLAGQYANYIAKALHEYKNDERKNPIMKGFSATLSDADIDDLAAYFSKLPGGKLVDLHGHVSE
ncbi:MAG TPA: cytochrome c [Rhodanobacteraceae bacterium]|nr:cytochrome c [Rhodanobacteraceae bacterium]